MIYGCLKCRTIFEEDQEAPCPECFSDNTILVTELIKYGHFNKEDTMYEELEFEQCETDYTSWY